MKILADRNLLYDIDLPESGMVALLEVLMRRYTGIFSGLVPIREEEVAGALGLGVPQLRQLLYRTSLEHVINYVPGERCSVIFLHHNRLMEGNVNLQREKYNFLLTNARERAAAMAAYASDTETCRSRQLLRYFGQEESADCGCCDVCRARGSAERSDEAIRSWWRAHPDATPQAFRAWCADPASGMGTDAVERWRNLLDKGLL